MYLELAVLISSNTTQEFLCRTFTLFLFLTPLKAGVDLKIENPHVEHESADIFSPWYLPKNGPALTFYKFFFSLSRNVVHHSPLKRPELLAERLILLTWTLLWYGWTDANKYFNLTLTLTLTWLWETKITETVCLSSSHSCAWQILINGRDGLGGLIFNRATNPPPLEITRQ